jgi:hypothetical protein
MKSLELNVPTLGFIIATRAMIGAGIGLLVSSRIPAARRKPIGLTLLGIGAASTIPALIAIRRAAMHGTRSDAYRSLAI